MVSSTIYGLFRLIQKLQMNPEFMASSSNVLNDLRNAPRDTEKDLCVLQKCVDVVGDSERCSGF